MSTLGYVAVEGPIGVGKTTLATRLAESLEADLLLEAPEENPFLGPFYDDPAAYAFQAQLFFLLQRARQVEHICQQDMFAGRRVTDFMFDKDPLFARLTLSGPELALYEDIYQRLAWQAPVPDKIVYLYASVDTLATRVHQRGRSQERSLEPAYLAQVADSYAEYFRDYEEASLVTVDAERRDLVNDPADYRAVLDALADPAPRIDL